MRKHIETIIQNKEVIKGHVVSTLKFAVIATIITVFFSSIEIWYDYVHSTDNLIASSEISQYVEYNNLNN